MSTQDLINYYAGLLIAQYAGKPKAYATIQALVGPVIMPQVSVQTVTFAPAPTAGTFTLSYNGSAATSALAWNTAATNVQAALQTLPGLGSVTVTGSVAAGFKVTFTGVVPPAVVLTAVSALTGAGAAAVAVTTASVDLPLPQAVQQAFNVTGSQPATGVQLDILGKYAGVSRTGTGFNSSITLGDADFLTLIQLATIKNNGGSSLAAIQTLIQSFFPGQLQVFDYQNMQMSYLISASLGSQNLVQLAVTENLLPKPMGVSIGGIIYAPTVNNFFGFRSYIAAPTNITPFNSYANYNRNTAWLSYSNAARTS